MNDGQSPTNELEAIEGIVEDATADLVPKIGIVKQIDDPALGIVSLHVPGETDESRPDEWFTASPANRLYNAILPEIDDRVEFTCQDANGISNYRWHFLDRYESENGGAGKAVINEREDHRIMWDLGLKKLELTAGDCEIVMDETGQKIEVRRPGSSMVLDEIAGKAELKYGTNRIEISATGIDIYGDVTIHGDLEADDIKANNDVTITGLATGLKTHTHPVTSAPGVTGPPN